MGYDKELDRAIEESNAVQREAYARNPVTPSVRAQDDPTNTVGPEFGGPAVAPGSPSSPSFGIGGSVDYSAEFNTSPQPARPAEPVIAPPATAVRQAPPAAAPYRPRVSTEGSIIRRAAEPDLSQPDPTQSYPTQPLQPSPTMYQGSPSDIRARYDARIAAENQDAQSGLTTMRSQAQAAQSSYDAANAEQAARVAEFRAANGADMILRGGTKLQKQTIIGNAAAARSRADAAAGRASALNASANTAGSRNFIAENALSQEGINRAATAAADATRATSDAQSNTIAGEVAKQKLDQQRQIAKLSQVLASSGDPAARKRAHETILAMLGKDKPEQYKLHVVNRPDTMSADGMTVLRGGQTLAVQGPDGKVEVLDVDKMDGAKKRGGGGKPLPQTLAEYVAAMRADPRNAQFTDADLAAEYAKKGGGR